MVVVILIGVRVTSDPDLVCLCHVSSIAHLGVYCKVFFALLFIYLFKKDLTPPMRPHPISEKIFKRLRDKMRGGVHHQFINGENPTHLSGRGERGHEFYLLFKKNNQPI